MADRIFPNTVKKIGNKKVYNGINWASVEEQLAKLTKTASHEESAHERLKRFFDKHPKYKDEMKNASESIQKQLSSFIDTHRSLLDEENEDQLIGLLNLALTDPDGEVEVEPEMEDVDVDIHDDGEDMDVDVDEDDDGVVSDTDIEMDDKPSEPDELKEAKSFLSKLAAKGSIPKGLKEYQEKKGKKSPTESKNEEEKPEKGDKKSAFFEKMKSQKDKKAVVPTKKKKRVVSFTNPNQINADAVLAAEAAGDEELKQTILDARHQRRLAIASYIEKAQEEEKNKKAIVEKRQAFRESLVKTAMEKDQLLVEKTKTNEEDYGFKPVSDLSLTEQDAFMKIAMKNGFPKEYVISMITPELEQPEEVKSIVEIIRNTEMSREVQAAAVTAMIKTSELSQKDLNYLKNYWINQLGYPATDWVEELFTNKFYKRIGKKD